jgi:hypothetical protein
MDRPTGVPDLGQAPDVSQEVRGYAARAHLRRSVTGEPAGPKRPGPAGDGDVLHRRSGRSMVGGGGGPTASVISHLKPTHVHHRY